MQVVWKSLCETELGQWVSCVLLTACAATTFISLPNVVVKTDITGMRAFKLVSAAF